MVFLWAAIPFVALVLFAWWRRLPWAVVAAGMIGSISVIAVTAIWPIPATVPWVSGLLAAMVAVMVFFWRRQKHA